MFTEIMKYIQTFEKYGCKEYENGTKLYGHAPFIAPKAYNFRVFSVLSEQEIIELEQNMHREIPIAYRSFLMRNVADRKSGHGKNNSVKHFFQSRHRRKICLV